MKTVTLGEGRLGGRDRFLRVHLVLHVLLGTMQTFHIIIKINANGNLYTSYAKWNKLTYCGQNLGHDPQREWFEVSWKQSLGCILQWDTSKGQKSPKVKELLKQS